MKLLMIGPLPPPVGGARVYFSQFVESLREKSDTEVTVIGTWNPKEPQWKRIKTALRCFIEICRQGRNADLISFWASYYGSLYFSPLVSLAAFLNGKPWQVRRFGTGIRVPWRVMPTWEKVITRYIFRQADQVLLETKGAIAEMEKVFPVARIHWHGNYRLLPDDLETERVQCHRFVYLGKVNQDKGIRDIIAAGERFSKGTVAVDIFGPLMPDVDKADFFSCEIVRYCGVTPPESIPDLLKRYDALLLPTKHPGEGYPGAILEAYMAGIPVIASRWRFITEIVDKNSGILISPGSPEELFRAMNSFHSDPDLYQDLVNGAIQKREQFSMNTGIELFLELCRKAVETKRDSPNLKARVGNE